MVDWRITASRVRNSISSRYDLSRSTYNHQNDHHPAHHPADIIHTYTTNPLAEQHPDNLPSSVPSVDATSSGSSVSRVPGAFYIPNSLAQRASANMSPEDGAALRRQLAFDALALVRELPRHASGWVLVKRDLPKISALFRSQWMPFWAELRGGMLLCFDPNPDHEYENKRQIRLVFSATNCIIDLKNTSSYSQIKLRRADGQTLILRLSSAQEAQQLCVALQTHTFQYTTIRLADFDWITAIGKGASGKVFLVRDNRTNARLALKIIDKTRVFRTQLTFQHVINERLVLEMCSGCPFLIQLRYAFQTDSHLYFATDFYDGGDVFSLLQSNRGRLSETHARRIIAEIVLALSWLHERNIVYRDLKPENVVLDGEGHVRLADFGLAKVLGPGQDYLTQTICGTTAYAAPEMLRSNPYNVSLDLWCLGVFTYHVLSGRTPFNFKGKSMEEMEELQRTKQIRYSSSLSLEAVSLIKGLLQIDPFRRSTLEDVKRHPFFRGIDWMRVARKEPHQDDISRFVSDKEKRSSAVARLATARAQQLGVEKEESPATGRRPDFQQEISSMTLDRYLLRNINPEEWRHVSFSDDDDVSSTAEFPPVLHKKGTEMETWAIAGWAWTCSEASGYAAQMRDGRDISTGAQEQMQGNRMNVVNGRMSLPVWNFNREGNNHQRGPFSEASRPFFGQRASLQEHPTDYLHHGSSLERPSRPIDKMGMRKHDLDLNTERVVRPTNIEVRPGIDGKRSLDSQTGARGLGAGKLGYGKGFLSRFGNARSSLDSLTRHRRSADRPSRDNRHRQMDENIPSPRFADRFHSKSTMDSQYRTME